MVFLGKLLERETRDKIIDIIKECKMLDLKAAESIKQAINQYNQSELVVSDKRTIAVIDVNGMVQNPTYLRRAKGLVKNDRAQWVNEKTIQLKE